MRPVKTMCLFLISSLYVCLVFGQTTDTVMEFTEKTFCSNCPYNSQVFPRQNQSRAVEVTLTFSVRAITDFDEVAGHLNMVGQLRMSWNDELVTTTYNKSSDMFQELSLPPHFIWIPTISIFNSIDSVKSTLGDSAYNVRIYMTSGDIEWTFGLASKTGCSVDATKYPFDIQTCNVIFTARGYTASEIDFNILNSEIKTDEFVGSEEWNLTHTTLSRKIVHRQAFLTCTITLLRKPTFFMINMALPIFLLAILNTLVFLLPANTGERIGYAIAAFLTFAVFLSVMSASLPQSSFPMPLLSYYMLIMLLLSSSISFVTVFSLRFHFADTREPVPQYLKTLMARLRYRQKTDKCKDIEQTGDAKLSAGTPEHCNNNKTKVPVNNGRYNSVKMKKGNPSELSEDKVSWKMIAKALDMIFFIMFWLIYICLSLALFVNIQS